MGVWFTYAIQFVNSTTGANISGVVSFSTHCFDGIEDYDYYANTNSSGYYYSYSFYTDESDVEDNMAVYLEVNSVPSGYQLPTGTQVVNITEVGGDDDGDASMWEDVTNVVNIYLTPTQTTTTYTRTIKVIGYPEAWYNYTCNVYQAAVSVPSQDIVAYTNSGGTVTLTGLTTSQPQINISHIGYKPYSGTTNSSTSTKTVTLAGTCKMTNNSSLYKFFGTSLDSTTDGKQCQPWSYYNGKYFNGYPIYSYISYTTNRLFSGSAIYQKISQPNPNPSTYVQAYAAQFLWQNGNPSTSSTSTKAYTINIQFSTSSSNDGDGTFTGDDVFMGGLYGYDQSDLSGANLLYNESSYADDWGDCSFELSTRIYFIINADYTLPYGSYSETPEIYPVSGGYGEVWNNGSLLGRAAFRTSYEGYTAVGSITWPTSGWRPLIKIVNS